MGVWGYGVMGFWGSGFQGFRVSGFQGLGFWGLGFGVWSLGFRSPSEPPSLKDASSTGAQVKAPSLGGFEALGFRA